MPAKSKKQKIAMQMALAAKHGDIPKSKLKKSSKSMMKMSDSDLREFIGKPKKKRRG